MDWTQEIIIFSVLAALLAVSFRWVRWVRSSVVDRRWGPFSIKVGSTALVVVGLLWSANALLGADPYREVPLLKKVTGHDALASPVWFSEPEGAAGYNLLVLELKHATAKAFADPDSQFFAQFPPDTLQGWSVSNWHRTPPNVKDLRPLRKRLKRFFDTHTVSDSTDNAWIDRGMELLDTPGNYYAFYRPQNASEADPLRLLMLSPDHRLFINLNLE